MDPVVLDLPTTALEHPPTGPKGETSQTLCCLRSTELWSWLPTLPPKWRDVCGHPNQGAGSYMSEWLSVMKGGVNICLPPLRTPASELQWLSDKDSPHSVKHIVHTVGIRFSSPRRQGIISLIGSDRVSTRREDLKGHATVDLPLAATCKTWRTLRLKHSVVNRPDCLRFLQRCWICQFDFEFSIDWTASEDYIASDNEDLTLKMHRVRIIWKEDCVGSTVYIYVE